ncbi:MAG TPA: phenylacetate--CoA ligase, partial [Methanomicrobiales archaeon]|nr:phenylacetate--CoA ligase [Methanomicrobiales archaeon]
MTYSATEVSSRAELRAIQAERLAETVARAYENVQHYRNVLDEANISPDDIERVEDISKLPFTTKEDFRDNYPDGMFAVPRGELARIHASSGTTGKPKIVGYTESDLDVWHEVMARSLSAAGVEPEHVVQNAYGYGLFTGGLGFHDGVEELGACVIPVGGGNTARQIDMLQDLGSEVLACTPSYCLYL